MAANPPIRLLQITSASEIGGAEQIALDFIRYSDPLRVRPSLLCLMGRGPLARRAEQAGAVGRNWALESLADPRLLRRMQLYLREGGYDAVQTYGLRADVLTRWVANGMNMPVVSAIVSIDPWRRAHHVFLDRLTRDGVAAWIATSEAARDAWLRRERGPARKVIVIPTGIPDRPSADAAARDRARRRWKLDAAAGPVLAVLANLRPAKGHEDLIRAVRILRADFPGLVCICAGRDDTGGRIPALAASEGVGDAMLFPGFVSDPASVYDAADLAVLPSHWEGMPHALIEALRAGVASVATDVGGNREVVRHEREGLLCAPRDPGALAAAIRKFLSDDPARVAFASAARARYEKSFRVEAMVGRMTRVYERVVANRRSAA